MEIKFLFLKLVQRFMNNASLNCDQINIEDCQNLMFAWQKCTHLNQKDVESTLNRFVRHRLHKPGTLYHSLFLLANIVEYFDQSKEWDLDRSFQD